ncbi:MAG: menaquinone biosynthesis decarboxylase [Candidatus Bipolaricaulia bacterium]
MAYESLREFVDFLERRDELTRVSVEVDPIYEITEIADRAVKHNGPALLFERVKDSPFPLLINGYASTRRMNWALGVEDLDEHVRRIEELIKIQVPEGLVDKLRQLPRLFDLTKYLPKTVSSGACQQVVYEGDEVDLGILPAMKCWPEDGGRYITLPIVFTVDRETGRRNAGTYRMQILDKNQTAMHWQIHHGGAEHLRGYEAAGETMEVAVALGGDPALAYAATAPMPPGIDEMLLASFLRQRPVEMVDCVTVDLQVPACADFVLEGMIRPGERTVEGPFGDHTGHYSLADEYPVFHVTALTHRKDPIYPSTIVGKPPMEDACLAKATERLFLPLMQMIMPEVVDINLPIAGIFTNWIIVSIDKRYPFHAKKVMNAIWGTGQLSLIKFVVVVDKRVNVHDLDEVIWRIGNNVDPGRDIMFVEGPRDVLDFSGNLPFAGVKMGIDATRPWPEEGYTGEWPDEIVMSEEIKELVDRRWTEYGISL